MRVVEVPTVVPGQCFVCSTPNHPPFVDLEFDTEFEDNYPFESGALYVCSQCVALMGETLGILTRTSTEKLESQIEKQSNRIYELEIQNAKLEEALGSLVAARGSTPKSSNPLASIPSGRFPQPGQASKQPAGTK